MSEDGTRVDEGRLVSVVKEARGRLARIAGRAYLKRKAWLAVGAGAALAACRPLVWRLSEDAPLWLGAGRALGLFAAGSAVAAAAILTIGRRRGPTAIGAARAVDEATGRAEVITSGYAFAAANRGEPMEMIARRRAAQAAAGVKVRAIFPLPSLRPSARGAGAFALAAILAIGAGGYERGLAAALLAPPTAGENVAARALEDAAAAIAAQDPKQAKDPAPERPAPKREKSDDKLSSAGPALAEKARDAARAARRGDRRGALEKIEEMRSLGQQKAARAGDIGKALRKVAEALAPPGGEKQAAGKGGSDAAATPSPDAAESMRLLAEKMKSKDGGAGDGAMSQERVLERLDRAAEEARRSAGEGREANEAARSLSRAAQELRRGDREAASQALAQAAEHAAAMAQERAAAAAEAQALMDLLEKSGALSRAIQMAMLGQGGDQQGEGMAMAGGQDGDGEGENEGGAGEGSGKSGKGGKPGEGSGAGSASGEKGGGSAASALRRAILARLAAVGVAAAPEEGSGASNGSGPHMPDRHRSKRSAIAVSGAIHAPSQVGEGPRAIQAINGLGRGTEPPAAYREVFPTYDAAAEEGLADERIPAARRASVRRYFKAIRPE